MSDHVEKGDLAAACAGLLYPSESDAPLTPFLWKQSAEFDAARAVAERGNPATLNDLEFQSFAEFFEALEDHPEAARFAALRDRLVNDLTDLTVIRTGQIKIDVYVLGREDSGDWSGIHTVSIET